MADFLVPDWPVPANVRSLQTLRSGGCSAPPWNSFNLGDHVGDEPQRVVANRELLRAQLPGEPLWLQQVHGTTTVNANFCAKSECLPPIADASFSRRPGQVCVVMTADCLPVLFCDRAGTVVAAVHAGWRGLVAGVLEASVLRLQVAPDSILAWLGPAIGPQCFEVGDEVREAFVAHDAQAEAAFVASNPGKWLADIYALARQRLQAVGVTSISGGGHCTVSEADRYFSYRRDGITGRMASLIWLAV